MSFLRLSAEMIISFVFVSLTQFPNIIICLERIVTVEFVYDMESIQNKNHEHEPARSDERKVKKQKRGMKPRSKRNRKRARSNIHSIENISYKTHVKPLAIGGKLIESSVKFLRTVEPYPYTFSTFAKARWLGRSVLDVYSTEFGSYPELYYVSFSVVLFLSIRHVENFCNLLIY